MESGSFPFSFDVGRSHTPNKRVPALRYGERGYNFKKIKINVDNKSNISSLNITGKNYKGFFGEVNRLSMSNQDDKHYVFIDNIPKMDILFLVVNKSNKFYIIIISCNKKFDKDIFNILNLD